MRKVKHYYITDNGGCHNFTSEVGKTKMIQNIMMLAKTVRLHRICSKHPAYLTKKNPHSNKVYEEAFSFNIFHCLKM